MLLLDCPHCGPRDEIEFACMGERARSPDPAATSDEAWTEHLYFRDNPKGWIREMWVHAFGCGQWMQVVRNTATNEISGIEPVAADRST